MSCPRLPLHLGDAALAAMLAAAAAPLLAQSAYADPAGADAHAIAAPTTPEPSSGAPVDPPIAPFAVVHPTYVPSQPAVRDHLVRDRDSKSHLARSHPARVKAHAFRSPNNSTPITPPSADAPVVPAPAVIETPRPAGEGPLPMLHRAVAPAVTPTRPVPSPAGTILTYDGRVRLLGVCAGAAVILAAAGLALRRRNRRGTFPGAVAKTPIWEAVTPPDLTKPGADAASASNPFSRLGEPGEPLTRDHPRPAGDQRPADDRPLRLPRKRIRSGRSIDQGQRFAAGVGTGSPKRLGRS